KGKRPSEAPAFRRGECHPIEIMPGWLKVLARINPLSYEVDMLRTLMIGQVSATGLLLDFGVLILVSSGLVLIGAKLYPRVAV
ncbi:MAG: hypothetical protein ACUVSU_07160, partial [Aggregatilineaceae bacterium]